MNSKNKGSSFERKICERLSKWWSNNEHEDLYWRTASSGGRSTIRGKKGKSTKNSAGDICATSPIGQPLLDLVTLELKSGYNRHTLFDLIDKAPGAKKQLLQEWVEQAQESQRQSGSFSWMIIAKRDRREEIVIFPSVLFGTLYPSGAKIDVIYDIWLMAEFGTTVICTTLDIWLKETRPETIKTWASTRKMKVLNGD
jgi:hypothetical protein